MATQFCLDSCWRKPQNISTVIHEVAATVQEIALIHHLKEYTRLNSQLPGPTIRDIEKKTSAQLLDELKMHFHDPLSALVQRFSPENLERLFHEQKVALKRDLLNGQWKESFPGKLVFQRFCGDKLKCATERVREAYLDIALRNKPVVFQDILNIFSHFDTVV